MNVRNDLVKYFNCGWIVELMYLSKAGEISKRKVRILKIQEDVFHAYCYNQKAKRTFRIDHVLALAPKLPKERGVI